MGREPKLNIIDVETWLWIIISIYDVRRRLPAAGAELTNIRFIGVSTIGAMMIYISDTAVG